VIYVWKVIEVAYFKEPRANAAPIEGEAPLVMLIPTWIVVLTGIWLGINSYVPVTMATLGAETLLGAR